MTTGFRKQIEALCPDCQGIGSITYYASGEKYEMPESEPCDNEIHGHVDAIVKLHEDEVERIIGGDVPQYYERSEARTSKGIWYEAQQALVNEQRQRAAIEPKKEGMNEHL